MLRYQEKEDENAAETSGHMNGDGCDYRAEALTTQGDRNALEPLTGLEPVTC